MQTDDLINLLSRDAEVTRMEPTRPWWYLMPAAALSFALLWFTLGPRPDLSSALLSVPVLEKLALAFLVLVTTLPLLPRVLRPEVSIQGALRGLLIPAVVLVVLLVSRFSALPVTEWVSAARGSTLAACLAAIPLYALPMLAALLYAFRSGAPADPVRAGQLAGLVAGGFSVLFYSLHCPEDDPAFFGLWYATGVLIVVAMGGWLGRRVLKW